MDIIMSRVFLVSGFLSLFRGNPLNVAFTFWCLSALFSIADALRARDKDKKITDKKELYK